MTIRLLLLTASASMGLSVVAQERFYNAKRFPYLNRLPDNELKQVCVGDKEVFWMLDKWHVKADIEKSCECLEGVLERARKDGTSEAAKKSKLLADNFFKRPLDVRVADRAGEKELSEACRISSEETWPRREAVYDALRTIFADYPYGGYETMIKQRADKQFNDLYTKLVSECDGEKGEGQSTVALSNIEKNS